jgi:hypothetical protein
VLVGSRGDYSWWPASSENSAPNFNVLAWASGFFLHIRFVGLTFLPAGRVVFLTSNCPQGAKLMEWTTPQHEEIDLSCEVSSYANAEL